MLRFWTFDNWQLTEWASEGFFPRVRSNIGVILFYRLETKKKIFLYQKVNRIISNFNNRGPRHPLPHFRSSWLTTTFSTSHNGQRSSQWQKSQFCAEGSSPPQRSRLWNVIRITFYEDVNINLSIKKLQANMSSNTLLLSPKLVVTWSSISHDLHTYAGAARFPCNLTCRTLLTTITTVTLDFD